MGWKKIVSALSLLALFVTVAKQVFAYNVYVVKIYNPNTYNLTNYQMRIDLSNYLSTPVNLTVCYDANCTQQALFCYEQANGECNQTLSKVIWVNVSFMPAQSYTYLYIRAGNDILNNATTGDKVFLFYDNFCTNTSSEYTVIDGVWVWNTTLCVLEQTTQTNTLPFIGGRLVINKIFPENITVEVKDRIVDGNGADDGGIYIVLRTPSTYDGGYIYGWNTFGNEIGISVGVNGVITGLISSAYNLYSNVWYLTNATAVGSKLTFTINGTSISTTNTSILTGGYVMLISRSASSLDTHEFDWIRVRTYADQTPSYTVSNLTLTLNNPKTVSYTNIYPLNFTIHNPYPFAITTVYKIYVDNVLVNQTTVTLPAESNTTYNLNLNLNLTKAGYHTIQVGVIDPYATSVSTSSITVNFILYNYSVSYSNYVTYNSTKYTDTLNYNLKVRCGVLGQSITVDFYNNSTIHKTYTITCDNSTHIITDSYRNYKEGTFTTGFYLNAVNSSDNVWFGNETFVADLLPPTINLFNNTLTKGFRNNLTEKSYFNVTDTISPFINCTYDLNGVTGYHNVSATNYSKTFLVNSFTLKPNNELTLTCRDIVDHKTTKTITFPLAIYKLTFVDEYTNNLINFTTFPFNVTAYVYFSSGTVMYNQTQVKKWKNPIYLIFTQDDNILETMFQIETSYARLFEFPFTAQEVPETLLLTSSSNIYVLEFVPFTTQNYYIEIKDSLGRIAGWAKITPTTAGYAYLTPAHKYFIYQLTPDLSVQQFLQDILMTYSTSLTVYDLPSSVTTTKVTSVIVQKINNSEIEVIYKSPEKTPLTITVYDMYYSKIFQKSYPPVSYLNDILPVNLSLYPLVYVEVNNTKQVFTQTILGKGNTGYNPKEIPNPLRDFGVIFASAAMSALFFTRRRVGYAMVVFGVMMTILQAVFHASVWVGLLGGSFVVIGILYILILRQVL